MTIVYIILSVIGIFLAILLIIAALVKKEFVIEKQVVVHRPRQDVFDYIKMLKNQEQYSVWIRRDPNIAIRYTGEDGTAGATSAWDSKDKNVGAGEQEIKAVTPGEAVEVEVRFQRPFKATNYARTSVALADSGTLVTNRFSGRSNYPMNIMNLFMDKLVGKDMQQNLENLKAQLEK